MKMEHVFFLEGKLDAGCWGKSHMRSGSGCFFLGVLWGMNVHP